MFSVLLYALLMLKCVRSIIPSWRTLKRLESGVRAMSTEQDIVEGVVCKESEIPENGMKEFPLNDGKVLLVKQEGNIYAVGTKCNHYGAPLVTGTLSNGRIRCPWHGACFDLKSGDIEDFPGLDSLPCYDVAVLPNGDVKVCGNKSSLAANKRVKSMAKKSNSKETIVIIGGGAAGSSCAETLRQEGFEGRVLIISSDKNLPYDRPKVSKLLDAKIENIQLRKQEFYNEYGIEILTNETVTDLDAQNKTVKTASGKEIGYSKVFIACGANAAAATFLEGHDLENIFTVRSLDDANKIHSVLTPELNVVIIGSSFVAMESAAFVAGKVKSVTVLGRSSVPFENVLGKDIGQQIADLFTSKGVNLIMSCNVEKFVGENGKLTHVVADGQSIPADICITGLGVRFETDFLKNSGITLTKKGSVDVNEFLETNVDCVYAGGDVAHAPVYGSGGLKDSIGHWQLAQYHGHRAAANMLGKREPIKSVPFFFSMLFGKGLRYAGYGVPFDNMFTTGDVKELKFVAYFCKGDNVIATASIASDPIVAKFADLVFDGKTLSKNEAQDNKWIQ